MAESSLGSEFTPASFRDPNDRRPYLGDHQVVRAVLGEMLSVGHQDPEHVEDAINKATAILTGQDPGYKPMGPWNTEGLGNWIRGHMNGVPAQGGVKSAVEYALSHLALHQLDMIRAVSEDAETPEIAGQRMQSLLQNWTTLMLGIPGVPAQQDEDAADDEDANDEDADDGEEELPDGSHDFMDLGEDEK